jgi:hypothetical protein
MAAEFEEQKRSLQGSSPRDSALRVVLQTERPQGLEVEQGDAKTSTDTLITRGLTT